MRVGWRNRDKDLVEGEPSTLGRARHEQRRQQDDSQPKDSPNAPIAEEPGQMTAQPPDSLEANGVTDTAVAPVQDAEVATGQVPDGDAELVEPVRGQLGRLTSQIHGLQEQLDAFIARRNEAVAERASRHVASIVAAAEQSAAEIRASAERDAAALRERLVADAQTEVQRIQSEAQADAARIRTEAHAEAARAREKAIEDASAEIQAACAQLAEHLQTSARTVLSGLRSGTPQVPAAPISESAHSAVVEREVETPSERSGAITAEVEEAVGELQSAAAVLEQSLQHLRAIGDEPQPTD